MARIDQEDSVLPPYYRIEMFGGLCLVADGQVTVSFHSQAAASLLAVLAYRSETRYRRADLFRLLWPAAAPVEGGARLHATIAALQLHLEPAPIAPGRVLRLEGDQVFLAPGAFETDVAELRAALALTAPSQPEAVRRQALNRAVLLYTGELLAGMKDAWITEERERWAIIHIAARHEWEKLPAITLHTMRQGAQSTGVHTGSMPRSPLRSMDGPRRYVRGDAVITGND